MTPNERIEKVLNRANNTISDLPDDLIMGYTPEACEAYIRHALSACDVELPDDTAPLGELLVSSCCYGLHLCDVIKRLVWALENTVDKYEKARYRLQSWGDIHYVSDLEEGKI